MPCGKVTQQAARWDHDPQIGGPNSAMTCASRRVSVTAFLAGCIEVLVRRHSIGSTVRLFLDLQAYVRAD